jgi:hypothetical protein
MAGLVPAIHVLFVESQEEDVDARDEPGHDGDNDGEQIAAFQLRVARSTVAKRAPMMPR